MNEKIVRDSIPHELGRLDYKVKQASVRDLVAEHTLLEKLIKFVIDALSLIPIASVINSLLCCIASATAELLLLPIILAPC